MVKILIAGLGSIGRRHLRNLLALGEHELLLYRTRQSTLPDDELAGFPVESDLESALAWRPQAAIIANPTALHLSIAIPAARAGCHLLLEKPVSHSMQGIDELQAALKAGGGQVLVGYQFRFHPGLQKVASLMSSGAIGRPLSFHAHWGEYLPGWHPWEDYRQGYSARQDLGGGVLLTLSHPLDYLRWLFGEVSALWAFAGQLGDLQLAVEDTAEVGLRFQTGAFGSVHLDYNQTPPTHHLEVAGTQSTLRWNNTDGAVSFYRSSSREDGPPDLRSWETFPPPQAFERNTMFLEEIRHFLAVARGETQPVCSLEDGLQAMRLALAAAQAAQEGRMVRF